MIGAFWMLQDILSVVTTETGQGLRHVQAMQLRKGKDLARALVTAGSIIDKIIRGPVAEAGGREAVVPCNGLHHLLELNRFRIQPQAFQ